MKSIHATFCFDEVDSEHPPGLSLAKLLMDKLSATGILCEALENWRDVGWAWKCSAVNEQKISVCLSKLHQDDASRWLLDGNPVRDWRFWRRESFAESIRLVSEKLREVLSSEGAIVDVDWDVTFGGRKSIEN